VEGGCVDPLGVSELPKSGSKRYKSAVYGGSWGYFMLKFAKKSDAHQAMVKKII
jgi:hypothetical protein